MEDNKEAVLLEIPANELTEIISITEICRLCANQQDKLIGIYTEDGENNDLATKMNSYLPIKVDQTDDLPLQCCWQCASTVLAWHELFVTSIEADRRLRSYQFVTEKQLITDNNRDDLQQIDTNNTEINENLNKIDSYEKNENSSTDENATGEEEENISESHQKDVVLSCCLICGLNVGTQTALKKHMFEVHNLKQPKKESETNSKKFRRKKSNIIATFTCTVCTKSFTRKFDMQRHILSKHPETTVEPSIRSKNAELINKCKVIEAGLVYYECDICHKKFKTSSPFVIHYNIHTDKKLHCCHVCGKKFHRKVHLKRHVDRHDGVKNYSCEYCEQTFTSKTTKEEHLNTHTNNRPYMCDMCGKSFRQSSSLYIHKKFHNNVFPFGCNACDKKFRRMGELKKHTFTHTGEKPFKCDVCDKWFRLRQDVKRHMKTHAEVSVSDEESVFSFSNNVREGN